MGSEEMLEMSEKTETTTDMKDLAKGMLWQTIHLLEIGFFPNAHTASVVDCRKFLFDLIQQFREKEEANEPKAEG